MHALIEISIWALTKLLKKKKQHFRSDENEVPATQDNTLASPSIAARSSSSNTDTQNQTENDSLAPEDQNQDGIENLTELENLKL